MYDLGQMVADPRVPSVEVSAQKGHTMTVNESLYRVLRSHDLIAANTAQLNRNLHALADALAAEQSAAAIAQPRPVPPQPMPVPPQPMPVRPVPAPRPSMPMYAPAPQPAAQQPVGPLAARQAEVAARSPQQTPPPAPNFPPPTGLPVTRQIPASLPPVTPPAPQPTLPIGTALAARLGISRTQLVSRLVAGVGAVITLVGIAFILVLAAQNGYFGPLARTISSGALGAVLAGVAFVIRRRDPENAGAHALLATGAAAGYLGLYAAGSLYTFIPSWAALSGTAVLGLAVVAVAVLWRSQWLASLGVASASLIGAYLGGDPRIGVAFAVVLSVVAILAQLRTSWPIFLVARTAPALVLLTLAASAATPGTSIDTVLLTVIAGVFALSGLVSAWLGRSAGHHEQVVIAVLVTLAPLPALYAAWQLGQVWGSVALGILAITYLAAAALPLFDRIPRSAVIPVGALLVTFAGLRIAGGDHTTTVLAAVAAAYASVALFSRSRLVALASAVLGTMATLVWIVPAFLLVVVAQYSSPVGTSAFLTAWALLAYLAWPAVLPGSQPRWYRNLAIVLGLLAASATVDSLGVLLGRTLSTVAAGYLIASATVTVLWALASVMALWVPLRRGAGAGWVTLGLVLAASATAKLFLIDLSVLTGIERGLAFVGVGLLLLVLGVGYARAYDRARAATHPAAA